MPGSLSQVEAKGIGANDVALIERLFQRVMSEGPLLARPGPRGRLRTSNYSNNNNNYNNGNIPGRKPARSSASSNTTTYSYLGGPVGLYVAPRMNKNGNQGQGQLDNQGQNGNSENQAPGIKFHHNASTKHMQQQSKQHNEQQHLVHHSRRSASPAAKSQIARECGLKALPVNSSRWTPTGRSNLLLDLAAEQGPVIQNQVFLQAPEGNVNSRRGLSGSKVRTNPGTPRPGSQTPRAASLPGDQLEQHPHHHHPPSSLHQLQQQHLGHQHYLSGTETVGYPIAPSPRPQSKRFNTRLSTTPGEGEDVSSLTKSYRWNCSDQGTRLQRQLSSLSSCRTIKRASEMVSHRLDPMYLMNGAKLSLQNRYCIDDTDVRRLNEMSQIREGLLSDLKKMKFPYGARASKHVVSSLKLRPTADDTPRFTDNQSKGLPSKPGHAHHPSTPASEHAEDVSEATNQIQENHSEIANQNEDNESDRVNQNQEEQSEGVKLEADKELDVTNEKAEGSVSQNSSGNDSHAATE